MRCKAVLALLTLLAVALSGCTGEEPALKQWRPEETRPLDGGPADDGTPEPAPEPEPQVDDGNATPTNTPPVARLSMSIPNGSDVRNVTFTLDGTDADGDPLNWTFTVGNVTEDGTELPATLNVTLEPGNWTAALTVRDGRNETVASLAVSVPRAGGDPNAGLPAPIQWSGAAVNSEAFGCLVLDAEVVYFYFDAALSGSWGYRAEGGDPTGTVGLVTEWWAGDTLLGTEGAVGTIPATADNVAVCPEVPVAPGEFTLTLHHPDWAFP